MSCKNYHIYHSSQYFNLSQNENGVVLPHIAPNRSYASRAAPPACAPGRLLPKTNISFDFSSVILSGVYSLLYIVSTFLIL